MNGRSGLTLIEVLVAIFVAAIGTLSLLVLFPLGALNMARAIRDDRCAQAAINAAALADALRYRTDGYTATGTITSGSIADQLINAQNPVYIDAIGATVLGSSAGVGGLGGTAPLTSIARLSPSIVATATGGSNPNPPLLMAYKLFRLQDDMAIGPDGSATPPTGESFINRGGRYTWAYMVRPPGTIDPGSADISVVVYDGRNTGLAGGESFFSPTSAAAVGSTSLTISYPGTNSLGSPPLRRGSWILDASPKDATNDPSDIGNIHAFFYRVVDFVDTGSTFVLDLETPLVAAVSTSGTIVVLDNVAGVYDRRTGWRP
jgi:prepilin-type N-terminal cleavage/methylation domain-containing protein